MVVLYFEFNGFFLNILNSFVSISEGRRNSIGYVAFFWELSKYLLAKIGVGSSKQIGETRRLFSSARIKLSIYLSALTSAMSAIVRGLQESLSADVCFGLNTC